MKFGGGGYVTGLVFHPSAANLLYARTDVGGAYRWSQATASWVPITDGLGFGAAESRYHGIESIAVDPNDDPPRSQMLRGGDVKPTTGVLTMQRGPYVFAVLCAAMTGTPARARAQGPPQEGNGDGDDDDGESAGIVLDTATFEQRLAQSEALVRNSQSPTSALPTRIAAAIRVACSATLRRARCGKPCVIAR